MLEAARRVAAERAAALETVQAVAEDIPLDDESFDVVVNRLAARHLIDVNRAVREMVRLLTRDEATYFLERQIIDEVRRILVPNGSGADPAPLLADGDPFARALRHIEARLFEKLAVDDIARAAGRDVPTTSDTVTASTGFVASP